MTISESHFELENPDHDELEELRRLETNLLQQLRERLARGSTRINGEPSIAQLESELIQIHGRKSTIRARRSPDGARRS